MPNIQQPPLSDTVTFNLSHANKKLCQEGAEQSQCGKRWNSKCGKKQPECEWG